MGFFFVALTIFAAAYGYVGWRLSISQGPVGLGLIWLLLSFHFAATFVSFALIRKVGPTASTEPLFWFVYVGMGLFSFVFTGLLVLELGWAIHGFIGRQSDLWAVDGDRRDFLRQVMNTGLLALSGVAGGWAVKNVRQGPDVVEVDVPIENLSKDLIGYRIVQVSDLHVGPTIGEEFVSKVVDVVNSLQPDLIALTGDFVDGSVEHLSLRIEPLRHLKSVDGVFFVTGNHEYYSGVGRWCRKMRELGATVLLNAHHLIERGAARLVVAGVTDYSAGRMIPAHASDPEAALADVSAHDHRILLAHQPKSCHAAKAHAFDLQLSGHTHGGQIFPWNLLVPFVHPFSRGLYPFGRGWVYVNPGTGYWGPPMRLGVPSEITVLRLVRSMSSTASA